MVHDRRSGRSSCASMLLSAGPHCVQLPGRILAGAAFRETTAAGVPQGRVETILAGVRGRGAGDGLSEGAGTRHRGRARRRHLASGAALVAAVDLRRPVCAVPVGPGSAGDGAPAAGREIHERRGAHPRLSAAAADCRPPGGLDGLPGAGAAHRPRPPGRGGRAGGYHRTGPGNHLCCRVPSPRTGCRRGGSTTGASSGSRPTSSCPPRCTSRARGACAPYVIPAGACCLPPR